MANQHLKEETVFVQIRAILERHLGRTIGSHDEMLKEISFMQQRVNKKNAPLIISKKPEKKKVKLETAKPKWKTYTIVKVKPPKSPLVARIIQLRKERKLSKGK
jgi:hypothetical protein